MMENPKPVRGWVEWMKEEEAGRQMGRHKLG